MTAMEVRMMIAGSPCEGATREDIVEPTHGRAALRLHLPTRDQVGESVAAAARAFESYGETPAHARSAVIHKVADAVAAAKDSFVELMIMATGKVRKDAAGEVDRSLETLRIAAEEAVRIAGFEVPMDASPRGEGRIAIARRYPVGVVAAITPFNAPLNTVCHKIAPALAAGNTVVLKPDVRGAPVAMKLAELFAAAGLPAGALNVIHGDAAVGEMLVRHPAVDLVAFTGSDATGERILSIAGLKRVVLELGGNAPFIVHHDADLRRALEAVGPAAFGMSGQSCISVQRVYAHASVFERFVDGLVARATALKVGDPNDPGTDLGPLITEAAARRVEGAIREAIERGARLHCGGARNGAYVTPAVLTHVDLAMTAVGKEIFGPVVSVFPYDDIDEAIADANATPYGLQAGLFTNAMDVILKAGRKLRFGGVIVNGASRWRLDHMPYGGVKRSGIGREGPKYAIEDMTELRMLVLG
jgi:acyl-CoA reductase-like NAD-dependent aldehyde dehydrogenase